MRPPVRPLALVAIVALLAGSAACSSDNGPEATARQFVDGWSTGDLTEIDFVDAAGGAVAPADVSAAIGELSGPLAETPPAITLGEAAVNGDVAEVPLRVEWPLTTAEDTPVWAYDSTVRLSERDGDWRVIWEPAIIHPQLEAGDELALQRLPATRGDIVDADGDPLMTARDVVDVGIWPAQASELESDLAVLDDALRAIGVEIDMESLTDRIAAADPDQFVPVVTLRWDDYEPIRDRIRDLGATTFRERQRHLAPSATFARALLGVVDEVTAELMEEHPGVYAVGDQAGHSGLSREYDAQLRGTPGHRVSIARTAPDGDVQHTEVFAIDPVAGTDLQLTLDPAVQEAAERTLHRESRRAALVAVRISDGAVLAVANTHGDAANPVNLALTGSVPPGSTFKMVSGYGLLAAGAVGLDTPVACPAGLTVDGFTIGNAFSGDRGDIPFREAMAISCNTAYAALAPQLGDDGLAGAGAALGIGGDWGLGVETFTGEVSTGGDPAERAAAAFGQGTTLVSPAAMAAATAAVARGEWLPPVLVIDPEAAAAEPAPLDAGAVADLHDALRAVVTDGTASALAAVPGAPVHGKTGSAEAGEATHGWFVGWQDDLAVAVFVEDGDSGSGSAVPLAGEFLRALS